MKPIERLLFAQGGRCFFCEKPLSQADASVEHLVATANGGANHPDNCVACCKALNTLLGRMSLKEKLRVVLNQKGDFQCPNGGGRTPVPKTAGKSKHEERLALVVAALLKQGATPPRSLKTLRGTIRALFQKQISEPEVASLLADLQARSIIFVSGTKVSYKPNQNALTDEAASTPQELPGADDNDRG